MARRRTENSKAEPDREPREQFAALPWRKGVDGGIELLLITSRETRRWVIPKGWPMKRLPSFKAAAQEAFEEAGVTGDIRQRPLGLYHYVKRLKSGRLQSVRVAVFPLKVAKEAEMWPEQHQRERLWVAPAEAAERVDEPELKALLAKFSP
jgi:8-oxo-dGTP pyrophosphatase MutT (NUDIX family)